MSVQTFSATGNKATTATKLDKLIFNIDVTNHELIKQAYVAYLANGRTNLAQTKERGDVSGGGRKPWRQKGTGRARFGSSRNPIWRGGGVAFGPTGNESYGHKLPLKNKRLAIKQSLSLANESGKIMVIEKLESKEGKTAPVTKLLKKLGTSGNVLLVLDNKSELINRATNNIPRLITVQAKYLNVFDVMNADHIIINQKAVEIIHDWLGNSAKPSKAEAK